MVKMKTAKYELLSVIILTLICSAFCECRCTTQPASYENNVIEDHYLVTHLLHTSVCVVLVEPVVTETAPEDIQDLSANTCCCKAFWRNVQSLDSGHVVYVKTVYFCEPIEC